MARSLTIRQRDGLWSLRAGGAVLGESRAVLELAESGHLPVLYVPRMDIAMQFFEPGERRSVCPLKGRARYHSIITRSTVLRDAAWSYEEPTVEAEALRDHLAFGADRGITLEQL